jgi:hypothetical protein
MESVELGGRKLESLGDREDLSHVGGLKSLS